MENILFKSNYKEYYVEFSPTMERPNQYSLWCRTVDRPTQYDMYGERIIEEKATYFLGAFFNNKILRSPKLREYSWDIQKGAERLYKHLFKGTHRLTAVGVHAKMGSMTKEDRNREIVEKRLNNKDKWTWGRLGKLFAIERNTAKDIFERDVNKYGTPLKIKEYLKDQNPKKRGVVRV